MTACNSDSQTDPVTAPQTTIGGDTISDPAKPECAELLIERGTIRATLPNGVDYFDAPPGFGFEFQADQDFASYDLDSYRSPDNSLVLPYVYDDDGYSNPYETIPWSADMLSDTAFRGRKILSDAGYDKFSAPAWIYNSNWGGGAWVHTMWPHWGNDSRGVLVTRGFTSTMYGFHAGSVEPQQRGTFDPRYRIGQKRIQTSGDATKNYVMKMRVRAKVSGMTYANGKASDRHQEILALANETSGEKYFLNDAEQNIPGNQTFDYELVLPVKGQSTISLTVDNQDHFQYTEFASGEWKPVQEIKDDEIGGNIDYVLCDEEMPPMKLPTVPKAEPTS